MCDTVVSIKVSGPKPSAPPPSLLGALVLMTPFCFTMALIFSLAYALHG